MLFSGVLKLIDVDGCVKIGKQVSIDDSSLSFSPCYCAPEWAKFLIEENENHITIKPGLDVWSLGITICELVTLDPILKDNFANFMKHGRGARQAGFLFMQWLSCVKTLPLPKAVQAFDDDFVALLKTKILVCDAGKRQSLAHSLSHPYFANVQAMLATGPLKQAEEEEVRNDMHRLGRIEDTSDSARHKGTLWKLNNNGDMKNKAHWLKRDMWISANGALCYFSQKENRRLVLLGADDICQGEISDVEGAAFEFAFQVKKHADMEDQVITLFACETQEDLDLWLDEIHKTRTRMMMTFHLNEDMATALRAFKMTVTNRRSKVDNTEANKFEAAFRGTLWKVKGEGDRMKPEDWFERDMWLAKNGSLVYYSQKEKKELVYYTASDVHSAEISFIANEKSHKPWAFQVHIAAVEGIEFVPGEFAAESEEERLTWAKELERFGAKIKPVTLA